MRRSQVALAGSLLLLGFCRIAPGQTPPYDDTNPARVISPTRGFQPNYSYSLSDIESIDASSGAVSLHIPLAQLPAGPAGFSAGVILSYSSRHWETEPDTNGTFTNYGLKHATTGGWHLALASDVKRETLVQRPVPDPCGAANQNDLFQLRVLDPDGASHVMLLSSPIPGTGPTCEAGVSRLSDLINKGASTWYSIDGSYLRLVVDQAPVIGESGTDPAWPDTSNWTLYRQDGSSSQSQPATGDIYLRDRNGNQIKITKTVVGPDTIQTMTDAAGRTVTVDHNTNTDRDTVTQHIIDDTGNSSDLTWTVYYNSKSPGGMQYWVTNGGNPRYQAVLSNPLEMVSSLTLPNGLSYSFDYSSRYGELHQLTLPTGASATYTYRLDSDATQKSYYDILANTVATKTLAHDATSEAWVYSFSVGLGSISQSTFTAPDGAKTTNDFASIDYRFGMLPDAGAITKITNPDGSTVERTYQENRPHEVPVNAQAVNSWVSQENTSTVSSPGQSLSATSFRVFTSDKNGNRTSDEEYGWVPYGGTLGNAPLLREAVTTYINGTGDSTSTSIDANAYSNPSVTTAPRNLVESSETKIGNLVVSRSTYSYQEATPVSRMVGNLVVEYHWDSTKASSIVSGATLDDSNAVKRQYSYKTNGNKESETDARGNKTNYYYSFVPGCPAPNVSDLYRTGVSRGGSGSVLQSWTLGYNCYSGMMTSIIDPNQLQTNIVHDQYGRPKTITEGNLRYTAHTYDDVALRVDTWDDVSAYNDQRGHSVFYFDQLGRIKQTSQSDGSAAVLTDTRYVYSSGHNETWVSNPYWKVSDDSPRGWTVTRRDTMGRACVTESFSGAADPSVSSGCGISPSAIGATTQTFSATANWTAEQVTDAAGATKVLYHDVLGRMIAVVEDPAGKKYATYYKYGGLDDLTDVRQAGTCAGDPVAAPCSGGLARHFDYTSLKRLSNVSNPESAPIQYQYDDAGNLLRRQQGSVVICYGTRNADNTCAADGYDDLNRLKKKRYSDDTPAVDYAYDTAASGSKPANCTVLDGPIGRLASVGNSVSTNYYFYNKLGYAQCNRQATKEISYDFLYSTTPQGEWGKMTYPSGRTVGATLNDRGLPSALGIYASSVTYWPHGALRQLTLANAVVENTMYNSRLQTSSIEALAGSISQWKLENFYCPGENPSCASNNGNVASQKLAVPNTTGGTLVSATAYTYDPLNRLLSAVERAGSLTGTLNWTQNYGYTDASQNNGQYGNLRRTGDEVVPSGLSCAIYDEATNRCGDSGFGYDAAGNAVGFPAGQSAAYDAENRQKSLTDGSTWQYSYDGEGRRVQKTKSIVAGQTSTTTTYVYDAHGDLAAEYGAVSDATGCTTCYVTADHLGSTRLVTDANGNVKGRHDYLPFGYEIGASWGQRTTVTGYSAPAAFNPKFTGKTRDYDSALGLDYFGARYFSGAQGRFTSPDAVNLTNERILNPSNTLNKYVYGGNNPLKYVDPDGRDITVFYETGFPTGHIMVAAVNQQTNDFAILSAGPEPEYHQKAGMPWNWSGGVPGTTAFDLDWIKTADDLRQNFAALTIQTSPEVAQQAINAIRNGAGSGNWAVLGNNCSSSCAKVLQEAGLSPGSKGHLPWTPSKLWWSLYSKYANHQLPPALSRVVSATSLIQRPVAPGLDYGSPSVPGWNIFDFLGKAWTRPVKACVSASDDQGNKVPEQCQ